MNRTLISTPVMRECTLKDVQAAEAFAREKHAGQKYSGGDYFTDHVAPVVTQVIRYSSDPTDLVAAYLHDVVEDCGVTIDQIQEEFSTRAAILVDGLSDPSASSRKERKQALYEKYEAERGTSHGQSIALVKCCDRLVNHRTCISGNEVHRMDMYCKEFPVFMAYFGAEVWEAGHRDLWHELFEQYKVMLKRVDAYR
jgi:(p)ppGpp synthase/HD superfamily hydrolase